MILLASVIRLTTPPIILVSSIDQSNEALVHSAEKHFLQLLPKLSLGPKTCLLSDPLAFHALIQDKLLFLCVTSVASPKQLAFNHLREIAAEFWLEYSGMLDEKKLTRPYCLMRWEPHLTRLKNRKPDRLVRIEDISIIDIYEHFPKESLQPSKIPLSQPNWWMRISIFIFLLLAFIDIWLAIDLFKGWIFVLKGPDHKLDGTLAIFSENGFKIILGILSPVYFFASSFSYKTDQKSVVTSTGRSMLRAHTMILCFQLMHAFAFERTGYEKPEIHSLTTLQIWSSLFDSFSLPFVVIFWKILGILILYYSGFLFKKRTIKQS
jgi:hypothetical protein